LTQGMVIAPTFYREEKNGKKLWINPADVEVTTDDRGRPVGATLRSDGQPVIIGGTEKMAKSKNNGVDPQAIIDQYGADTARLFMMFAAPPDQQLEWSDTGVEGSFRFLKRVWLYCSRFPVHLEKEKLALPDLLRVKLAQEIIGSGQKNILRDLHLILQQANFDFDRKQFNTVVSACMKILNILESDQLVTIIGKIIPHDAANEKPKPNYTEAEKLHSAFFAQGISILLRLLSPIAPHITQTLWKELGYGDDILSADWPKADLAALEQDEIEIGIQLNGKARGRRLVPKGADKTVLEQLALIHLTGGGYLAADAVPKKIVVVPGRLINVVVQE
jgi:leucyl-tRNA synthetase